MSDNQGSLCLIETICINISTVAFLQISTTDCYIPAVSF